VGNSAARVVAGWGDFRAACSVLDDGRVHCWWADRSFWIREVTDAVAVSGRDTEGCALRRSGIVTCWRHDSDASPPFQYDVQLDAPVTLSASHARACAVVAGGRVACFRFGGRSHEPMVAKTVPGLADAVDVSVFYDHALALRSDGAIVRFSTELDDEPRPVSVATVPNAVKVVLGDNFACVNTRGGEVRCWGNNWMGRLGNGGSEEGDQPSPVANLSGVVEIAAGQDHVCARREDGSIACWGSNQFGQIGVPSTGLGDARRVPVTIPELHAAALAGSQCVLTPAGQLACWRQEQTPRVILVCR
jgi:hypothetical protein